MISLLQSMRAWRSGIASLLLLLYLPACTSWQVGTPAPAEFVEREHPKTVRVTRTDSTRIELMSPAVRDDSLVGTVGHDSTVSLALSDVQGVEVKRTDAVMTLALVGVVVIVLAVAAGSMADDMGDMTVP